MLAGEGTPSHGPGAIPARSSGHALTVPDHNGDVAFLGDTAHGTSRFVAFKNEIGVGNCPTATIKSGLPALAGTYYCCTKSRLVRDFGRGGRLFSWEGRLCGELQ
jgi:hypothetical protein